MNKDKALAMDLALEALEESVDLVREDYENAKKLYSNYPSRQARLLGLEDGLSKHEAAITAIKQARSAPVQEPDHGNELTIAYMSGLHDGKKKREWVGLTLADREKLRDQFEGWNYPAILVDAVADILKEKNT
jgi:hypothetical protein